MRPSFLSHIVGLVADDAKNKRESLKNHVFGEKVTELLAPIISRCAFSFKFQFRKSIFSTFETHCKNSMTNDNETKWRKTKPAIYRRA